MCSIIETWSSALFWEGFAIPSNKEENSDKTFPLGEIN